MRIKYEEIRIRREDALLGSPTIVQDIDNVLASISFLPEAIDLRYNLVVELKPCLRAAYQWVSEFM
jgi:hypothetical protein